MEKTNINFNQNIIGAFAYLFGFLTGIFFLLVEKKSKFVRFHAMQSTILFGGYFLASAVLGSIPFISAIWRPLSGLANALLLVVWAFLIYQAFKGKEYRVPMVGDFAVKQLAKLKV